MSQLSSSSSSQRSSTSSSNPYLDPSLLMFGNLGGGGTKKDNFLDKHHYDSLQSVDRDVTRRNDNYDSFNPYLRGLTITSPSKSIDEDSKQQVSSGSRRSDFDTYLKQQKAINDAYLKKLSQRLTKPKDNNNDATSPRSPNSPTSPKSPNSINNNKKQRKKGTKTRKKNKFERTVVLEPLSSYQNKKLAKMKQNGNNIDNNNDIDPNIAMITSKMEEMQINNETKSVINRKRSHSDGSHSRASNEMDNGKNSVKNNLNSAEVVEYQYGTRSRQSE